MNRNTATETAVLSPDLRRVLIVMTDHHMGNLIIALPVINALAAYFHNPPDVIVDERYAAIVRLLPAELSVISYPGQADRRRGLLRNLKPIGLSLALALKRHSVVFDLGGGPRGAFTTLMSFSRRRYGFAGTSRSRLYSRRIPRDPRDHILDAYTGMLSAIGRCARPPLVSLCAPAEAQQALESRLRGIRPGPEGPIAVIHPGAGKQFRQWPAQRFAAVADDLVDRHRMSICVIGAPGEQEVMKSVIRAMRRRDRAFALSLPLIELLALFQRSTILISNESGPTHMAAATDLPIVTIFGPSKESVWRPVREAGTIILRGAECDPRCGKRKCLANQRCLLSLEPAQVLSAVERLLTERHASSQPRAHRNDSVSAMS